MPTTLIVPGLKSSGATHWQTWLEHRVAGSIRITQRDWNDPHLPDWSSRIRSEIARASGSIFIVGHSFGALAAVQAASDHAERITGALLVAPADPDIFGLAEFLPAKPLGFPVIVVASTNDPWMPFERAESWSRRWGGEFVNLGDAGHINAEAGFGPWPEALTLLERLRRAAEFRTASERLAAFRLSHSVVPPRQWLRRQRTARLRADNDVSRGDVKGAAALLRDAGWTVRAPDERRAQGQLSAPL